MLKRNGDNGHPCPVLDLREKAFMHSSLRMMLAISFLINVFFFFPG